MIILVEGVPYILKTPKGVQQVRDSFTTNTGATVIDTIDIFDTYMYYPFRIHVMLSFDQKSDILNIALWFSLGSAASSGLKSAII